MDGPVAEWISCVWTLRPGLSYQASVHERRSTESRAGSGRDRNPAGASDPSARLRWVICGLLFFATTINYIDRQVLGILAVPLQRSIGWSESDYGLIVTAFQAAYALALIGFGRVIDRIGTRLGYSACIAWWSLAAMGHALARSAFGFGVARFALGLGEAGTSLPRLRPSPNGSRRANARSPRVSSIPDRTWAP